MPDQSCANRYRQAMLWWCLQDSCISTPQVATHLADLLVRLCPQLHSLSLVLPHAPDPSLASFLL